METSKTKVIDTHIHLADGIGGKGPRLNNMFFQFMCKDKKEGEGLNQVWDENNYRSCWANSKCVVEQTIYVQVYHTATNGELLPGLEEAKWTLEMVKDPESIISGTCVEIPCKLGAQKVESFLNELRETDGSLPNGLKGTRQIMSGKETYKDQTFFEGLTKMNELGPTLTFECCPHPKEIPDCAQVFAKIPNLQVVLNHMGFYNGADFDMETHKKNISAIAALPNVVCKIGAIENFKIDPDFDITPLTKYCLQAFGYDRCMYESNWFMFAAQDIPWDTNYLQLLKSLNDLSASEEEKDKVFRENAKRIYKLV